MNSPKKILFVCVENACRSQMAEGIAEVLGEGRFQAESAGSRPSGAVNPDAIRAMKEIGIDLSHKTPKSLKDLAGKRYDVVVTMGCGDACPSVPAGTRLDWDIPDPKGKDFGSFRQVRDMISGKVRALLEEIKPSRKD